MEYEIEFKSKRHSLTTIFSKKLSISGLDIIFFKLFIFHSINNLKSNKCGIFINARIFFPISTLKYEKENAPEFVFRLLRVLRILSRSEVEIRVESARKLRLKKEFKNIRVKSGSYALFHFMMGK